MCLLLLRFVICFVTFVMFVMCYMPVSLPTSPSYGGMPWEGLLHHIEAMEDLYVAIRAAETARGIQGNALHLSDFRGNVNVICMQRRGWQCGGTVHFFTSDLALSILCAMRHAPWRDSCLKWAHSRILQSLLTIALMSSGSFETFAVVCSNICPREVDIPAVQCEQPQLHTIAFHCQLRQNYDIQRHVT